MVPSIVVSCSTSNLRKGNCSSSRTRKKEASPAHTHTRACAILAAEAPVAAASGSRAADASLNEDATGERGGEASKQRGLAVGSSDAQF